MPTTITSRPTEAFLGGSKRFKCQVIGNPRPTIRWFKDGIDITNNPRYNFDFTMEGRISMVIPNVTYKDEGCYRCRAENSEGIASTASFLMVRGSVHEQRDEIPTTDVAEMEIEEVYIKKQEEREEYAESFRKRTEKKDRWKRSEVEYTEEMSSSSFQGTVQFESSQSESMTLDHRSWQMESESESETVAKTESDSGFVFEGQSMVIESQVFGKSQELLAELDSDPSLKTKPIFVDNRKRPSDEMEAEDVIELVVQEDTQGQSDEFGESMESEITSQEKEVDLFIDESSFEKTEKSDNESLVVSSGETLESVSKSSFTEQSREITMDSNISEVKHGEEKFGVEESASAEMSIKKSSEKESKEMLKQTGKKEENSAEKKLVEESLMSKMKTFREQREEETEELFIKEESETFVSKKESEVEEKKEKKLTEAEKRELKRKEEAELRKKKREEEEAAMVERMKKFRQQREEEEQVDIFSGVVEEVGESTTVVSEETSSGGVIQTSEGKQVQIEEFYSKETTVEGDIELSREKHKVFEFESSVSTQNFEEVTMEEESNEMIIEASVDMDGLGMRGGEEGLKIQADVAIEEIAVQEEEERLNEKNRKLSELHVDTSDIKAEVVESSRDQTKISGEVSTEEISYKSEEAGSFSIETEVVISEEVASTADSRKSWQKESKSEDITTKKEEEGRKTKPETELDISVITEVTEKSIPEKDGFKISTEVETEEKHYKESSREETTVIVEERKESVHVDGVAFGEKAELEAKREDLKEADELEGRKAEEKTTNLEMSEKAKVDESLRSKDLERGEVVQQSEAKVREGVLKTDEGTTSKIAEVEGVQKTAGKDVDGVAEAVKVRPKLTAEASVGEDETLLEAVVDVKETQTDRGDVSNGLKEKESVITSEGVESQAVLADEVKGAETVSVDELSKESLSSTQQAGESLTVSKREREELLSEVLSTSIQSEDISVMKTETKPEETFATQKDIPGIAEGIKVEQDEYRAGLQEQKMPTEEVVENGDAASAEKTEQLEAASDLGKATKDKPEYRVDAADLASEDVSTLAEEAKVECDILKSEEAEKVSALQTQKSEALASAAEAEKELHVTEDLDVSLKTESADVDGIAEGEKHRATADSGAESKVAESVVEAELKEAREFGQDQETLVESETAAKDKAAKDAVTSQVDEQVQDVEELKKLGPSETAEKAMEVTGEVTVETTIGDQPESKVDVQSSVDSVQFSSELEQKASVDITVVSETSVKESTAEISVTTETSTTDEPLKMTAEVDVSSTKAPEEEVGKLDVLAEMETESKSAEEDTKTLTVDVDETPAKLELSASVDIETSQKPDEATVSAEVDISEPQEEVKVTSEVSMEETAKDIEEEPSQPTTTPPEVVNGPAEISVEVGQTINIEVTLTGFPAPTVSWKKGFKNIEEGKNVKMIANGDVYTLQILNTVVADAGKYRLTASNSEGRTTFDVKVDVVLPKQKDKKEEIEATSQRPEKTAPEVTGPAEISVEMGQTLSVEVTVKGNPAPRVSWYKDDQQVVPNYRKKTTVNGEVYILQILNTVEADAGCYRVTAVNQKGETSCDIKVTVTLPAPPPDTSTGGEDVEASVTLKDKEPDEVTISAEVEVTEKLKDAEKTPMEVTSEVSVEETPAPKEITADVKVEEPPKVTEAPEDVSVEAEVKTTAEVPKHEMAEKVEDVSASVLIKDEPGAKQQEVSAEVDVGEEPSEPAPSPPEVINGPVEISVEVGQTVNIEVTLLGFPAPKVSWKKGFKNIEEGKNVKMIANGDVYTLQILNTVVADAGKYRLTASNSEGRTTFDVKVNVVLPKQKDKKEEIEATPQRPEKTAPEVTGPAEISVEMGQTLAVEVTVKGNPAPRVSWYKDDQQVVPNYRKKTTVDGELYILQVLNTVEADAGCYRATAVNQKGETSCDIKVTVTLPAPPPDTSTGGEDTETSVTVKDMEPPELSTKPESQSMVEGEPVSLSATVTATTEQKISSGETVSMKAEGETPDDLFMKAYIMISDHKDAATDFSLKKGETVEVLDTVNKDKWLVRKQADKEKVCYVPVNLLKSKTETEESKTEDVQSKTLKRQLSRRKSEEAGSSGEEDSIRTPEHFPLYVAVADYNPPDGATASLKLSEGQFVEVMDMENTEKWLVRTKPTKATPSKQGWVPASYLEEKNAKGSRSTRETFREDIIKISNKQQEALVKRSDDNEGYVLTDLLETEREYINQLNSIKECFHDNMFKDRNIPDVLKEKKGVIFGNLKDIQEFHSDVLLPALTNCALNPGTVGKVILNLKDQFEKYIPYGSERDTADFLLSGEDVKKFLKDYNRKSGSEQVLPDCLRRPIARIHEYQAVLKDILKYSCRAGEDSKDIEGAIHMLSEILRRIEDVKLLRTVEGFHGDLSSLGTLIRHGDLQMWDDEPVGKGKDRHMFLFPHKLLLAKPNKDRSGFIHKATCELQDIQVNETVPSDDRMFELWYAEPTSEKLTFQARSVVAKEAWVNQIREALKSLGVEETDIMPEQQRPTKGPKIPTPSRRKSKDTVSPEKEVPPPGDSTGEDYLSFESLDSDVSSYHTAPEFEDGTTRPVFKKRLCRTVVKEGDKACLECTVGGIPLPTVAWQKGVYPIKSSDELRIEVQGAWNALVIPETICEDSGVYTAKATNVNGSAVCSAELTVGDGVTDQEYITAQSALSSEGEITLPAKMGQMDSCVVEEGKMARFDCNLVADPKPEIMWLKDGKILTTSKKYEVLNPREDLHSLIVHDVNKDDSGRYVCWARNEFGEAFTEAYLNIIPSAEAESDVERIAPKITKKFYDLVATNGHSAELKFKFIGSPMPHIQWYIKNKEVLPPREFDVKVEGDQCTFTLKEVSMEDAGKIIVKLTNPLGEDRCSAQLTVIEDFSKPRGLPKVAPKFITRFTDVDVNQGFEARFKSKVIGEPIPTVTWLRNGVPLKDCPRYKYEEYGEIFILIIENAEQGDAGEYMCVAKNKAGEASCKANLMVTKVAIPQVRKGVNGEMGPQFGYAPVFTKMIQDCDTKEGRRAEFECRAYGMPEPTATWTHNGIPMERGDRFIMSKDEDSNYHLMIKDVLPTDAGQYSCKLANFAGKASCSAELRVEALPRRDPLRLSPERGIDDDLKTLKKAITEPPSMPDQKPVLLDKTPDTVRLSWLPAHVPSKSQGAQPIMYIVESRELPTGDWRRMASMIPTTSYQAKGLNPNAEYLFRVRAENDNGMSEPTTAAVLERRLPKEKTDKEFRLEASPKARKDTIGLSTELMTGPSLPSDRPTLLDIRPESVRIQWVPVTLTGPGADYRPVKYLLEVKEIPGPWRKLASGLTGNSYFATDLNPDREYNFRVRAENKFAESEPTLPATLQKGRVAPGQGRLDPYLLEIPKVPPALPASKPYVSDIGDESLRLSWKPADIPKALKGVSPTSYRIEVQELPKQDWQTLVSYIPDTTYRLTDLRPRQDYNFRIRAENEFGLSEPSRPFYLPRATTYPGAAVTRPDIVELEREAVRLNWQRVEIPQFESDEEPLTYMIEGRTPSSDWRELVRGIRGTSHRLAGLETSEDYSFRVRPDSSTRGLGEPSPPMSLSRALARTRVPVSDLEVEEIEPTSVRLKWDRVHIPPFDSSEEPLLYMIEAQEGPYADWRTVASGVPTTAFRLTDLRPEKDYAFRVRAETEYGISEPSPPKPLYRKPPEAPRYHLEPPRIDSFDAEGLQLSWKPMSPHPRIRRADPPKYTIEMREAPQADWRPVAAGVPDTSFRLTGLRPEQDYTFRVRAEMPRLPEPVALITPAVSLLRGGVPPVMPSSAPTISKEKPNSLRLSWRPANLPSYLTGESGPIRYQVEMLESPSTEWRTLATRHPDLSFEVSRLHPDREYAFRVRAQTESGTSAPTAPAYLYRKPIPHLPKAEPLLSDIRPDSVRLTWQAVDVPGKVTDFQKVLYMIEMQEPPSQTWTPFVRDVHEINHRVQNLRPDKDYVFRVRAVTDQGMSEPTMSVYLPRRAVQPRLPMAEPYISEVKVDSARLSWTPVDTPPFGAQMVPTTYRVEIQEPPNTNWQTLVRKLPTTNYLLTNLRPDKAYCLRVRAENDYGVSEPTRAVQLPRRAVAPIVPSDIPLVTDVRRGSMRLTWQPASVPSYGGSNMTLPVTYTIEAREPGHDWSPLVRRIPHTSYFLSGLKPEGDYEFRVRAESQYGLSPPGPSTALPRQLVARIPIETPEIIDIEPDGRSLTLRWRRADIPSRGASELITYIIEAQEPPSMDWSPMARGVMDTKYRLTGLRPGQDYLFRVRAETGQGLSEPTLPVTFYRRMVSPRVPVERPQLYDLEPDAVRLSWQPTSTYQAETPLRYTVEVREPQIKKWRPIARNIPETSYHVTGLKPKLDYEFRVRPETDKGLLEPTPSIPLYRKRVLPPLKFVEPVIVDDEPETVRLNWQRVTVPRLDAGDEELTYMIEAQRGPTMEWQPIARNIRDTSYQLTGLGPYEDYHFRIRGESRDFGYTEPSPSLPLYRRPILPNVPVSRPVIEDVDSTSVRLGWQRVHIPSFGNDDSPLTFMVESQEGPGSEWRPIARDIPDTKYVIRDLKPRHDYNFRIRGIKGPEISDPTPPLPVFRSPLQANWRPIREDFTRPSRPYFECLTIRVPPSMPIEKPILTDITGDSVGLTWRPARVPSNSNPPLYNVEIRKLPNMNWQRLAGGLTMTTYKATKLNPDRSYMFRIKAENEYGTSGSTMPASLGRPGIDMKKSYPEDEDGEDQGFGQRATPRLPMDKPSVFEESPDVFAISWAPARIPAYSKPSKIRYIIEKREPPSHDWTRVASNINDTRHTVKGLKPDKDIMFRIRAESDFGVSDPTLAASVNRRPVITIPPRTKDIEEESLMLAPSTFISGTVGTATAPRAPTGRPTISEVKDTTLELSWFPARVPAYMKQTPVTYSVEIREPPSTNWAPLVSGLKETGYSVENLKPKKDYMFRVRAENEHGTSEPTLPAILERPPEPKPEVERRMTPRNTPQRTLPKRRTPSMERDTTPLRFTSREATPLRYTSREPTPLRKGSISGLPVPAELIAPFDSDIQYGVEGQQAQICLGLRGFPLPTIQWFFKGKPLENDDKYNTFISPGGEATLTVNDVCPADIGEYKCNAENEHGVAVKIVQLDLADPPTFIEPLKDITIIAKNSGVLECRVDGIPYPEVKWNKDWRPLVESSRVFMDHESPDYWSLSLSSALKTDGGLYACIAENVAGKVHCVANVIVEDQAPSKTTLKYKQANIEDHFHILEEKGRGRTSIVRRVIEKSTGKEFAAKFIQVRDPGDKDVFKHELECLRLASHKNIVAIQDAYETERRLVLVSELVSGPELLDKVVSEGTWTESDAAYFIKQTLDLLQHLHSEGVVVVDLKPWDILLSIPGSDEVKLVDLGFARRLAASRDVRTSYGTAEFVAPEVVAGEPLSPSADVWSVGVLAYILLSGISPFYNHSDRATLLTVQGADWDFDAKAFENISKEARDFISKVLLKEAGERLTIGECLDHPWMKNAIKRGQGLKINVTNHKALNDRYRTMRSSTVVKTVADIRPLGKQTEAVDESGLQSEVDPATGDTVYPDSQAYGEYLDEETWLDWQTRYQHGPGTQLMPLKETDLPLRIREYRRQKRGEMPREARSPSKESEMGEDRKMMKERLLVADVEAEFEPSPSRRKEFEWIVQPEEVKEARRRTSSESESQPQKTVGVRTEEGFSPIFLEKLKDAAYLVGEDATFSCHVMANPAPSITWYRNEGMLSDGQRIRTSLTEDGRASITVLNTMPNDVGVYKCIVRNKLGTVTSRARLLLGDNPERPGRPVVCAVSSDEALLVWNAPKSDGNSYITNYRVDYRKAGEDRWTSAVSVLDECALVPRLKPSTIYRFRVSCSNRFGVSPFSWSSVEVRTKAPGAPAVSIDEEIERLLLRSRKALEKPSPRESAVRSPSLMRLETIEEEMKTTSPEEEFNFGEDIRKGAFSSIKCVSRKVGGEELVAKMAAGDSKKKDELIREFSILRPLQQENIVRLVSGYQTPQQVCLIMERLYGDNVVQHLSFKNTYTEESVAFIIQQVLDAVQYLHHCGVAHLNLQPSSVMLASRRRLDVKIVDFSLARSITNPEGSHMPKMGFPDFLSPEMVAQEKVGFAADVWTIGALTFLLLSGESPFLGETDLETFANIAYIRYDAQDLYENVTKEGLKFIYDLLKRLPRNRLGVEECLEHKWLQLTPNMVKARQEAVFLSNKLRRYAKDYHQKRLERSGVFILSSTPPPLTSKPKITEVPALSEKKDSKPSVKETKEESVAAEVKKVKPKSPSPEPKLKTPSPEPVKEIKPKTPSPEPKPKTPSPEPIQEEVKPKTPPAEPVQEVKPRTPTPEPKPKTPSPEPVQEVKPRTPTPEPKPKTPSPEPMKEEVKPKTPSPEPVQEEVKPKIPSPEPVTKPEKSEIGEETEANTQPIIKEVSSEERSPVSSVEEKSETGVDVVEMEAQEGGTTSEEVQISLYTTEEPVTPIPGPTPERETVEENIEAIMEMSEEGAVTQADTSVKLEGSVEVTASQSQSQTVVEYSEESSSTSHTIQMSSVVESRQSSSAETAEEVSVQFSTSSETVEEVVSLNEEPSKTEPVEESASSAEVTVTLSADESLSKFDEETVDVSETVVEAVADIGMIDDTLSDNAAHKVDVSLTDVTSEDISNAVTLTVDDLDTTEAAAKDEVITLTDVSSDVTLTAVTDDVATDVTVSTDVNLTLTDGTTETVLISSSNVEDSVELSLPPEESEVAVSSESSQSEALMLCTVTSTSEETSTSVEENIRLDDTQAEAEVTDAVVEKTVQIDAASAIVGEESGVEQVESNTTPSENSDVAITESVNIAEKSMTESADEATFATATEEQGIVDVFSHDAQDVISEIKVTGNISESSAMELVSSTAEEVDIFGEDDDYFAERSKRSTRAMEITAASEELHVQEEEEDDSSRRSSRRSRRSARSYEISGSEEGADRSYSEDYMSSRQSRRSARSYDISGMEDSTDTSFSEGYISSRRSRRSERSHEASEMSSSSRESRRSGWRSRLGDL